MEETASSCGGISRRSQPTGGPPAWSLGIKTCVLPSVTRDFTLKTDYLVRKEHDT
jgi:hypothetical protein